MGKKTELSILNVLFCVLVVLIHVLSAPVTQLERGSLQYVLVFVPWRLSAFVVQGFIFLSGVKMALGFAKPIKYIKYLKLRFLGVVIPYIIWVFVFYMYFLSRNYFEFSLISLIGYILKGDLVSHFYFIIIIVQFYLLRPVWKIMTERIKFPISLLVTIIIMYLSKLFFATILGGYTDRVFTSYLIFWVCGCYMGANYDCFKEKLTKNIKVITTVFFIVAIFQAVLGLIHFTTKQIYCIETIHFIYCNFSVFFCVAGSFYLGERLMSCKLLKQIDSASYYIYLVHPLFIFLINDKMAEMGLNSIGVELVIRTVFVYTVSIISCILYIKIKKKPI